MTMIIGIAHPRGLVVAADGEESGPTHKRSVSKLVPMQCSNGSSLIIGGAGPAYLVDAVIPRLQADFIGATTEEWQNFEGLLRKRLKRFYAEHVLSWPSPEERESNDFSLLLGVATKDSGGQYLHRLLVAERGVLREEGPYAAVGVAEVHAKSLIDEYLSLRPNLLVAVIAAYVLHRIKGDTNWVGKQTEIFRIENGSVSLIHSSHVEKLEDLFKTYEYAKVRHFLTIFSVGFSAVDTGHDSKIQEEMGKLRGEFRKLIERINDPTKL